MPKMSTFSGAMVWRFLEPMSLKSACATQWDPPVSTKKKIKKIKDTALRDISSPPALTLPQGPCLVRFLFFKFKWSELPPFWFAFLSLRSSREVLLHAEACLWIHAHYFSLRQNICKIRYIHFPQMKWLIFWPFCKCRTLLIVPWEDVSASDSIKRKALEALKCESSNDLFMEEGP